MKTVKKLIYNGKEANHVKIDYKKPLTHTFNLEICIKNRL